MKDSNTIIISIGSFKIGGAERMAINVGTELLRKGYDVHFALQKPIMELPHQFPAERIHILNKHKIRFKWAHFALIMINMFFLRRKLKAEIVIGFTYFSSLVACFSFARIVVGRLDTNPYRLAKKRRLVADMVVKCPWVRIVVVPSIGLTKYVRELRPRYASKFRTIHNSIDIDKITRLASEDIGDQFGDFLSRPLIVSMGRMTRNKNFEMLISAFSQSIASNVFNLVIIGDGQRMDALKKAAADSPARDRIFFTGMLRNPFPLLSKSRLFVNTSNYESFCNVILESLLVDVPVVATNCDFGPADIITHGVNGYLIEPRDVNALKQYLDQLVENPGFVNEIKGSLSATASRFRLDQISSLWSSLVEELKQNLRK